MVDPSRSSDPGSDAGAAPPGAPSAAYPGTPRWVTVSGIVVLALILLFVVMEVASGGQHSPARHLHLSSGAPAAPSAPGAAGVHAVPAAQGVQRA